MQSEPKPQAWRMKTGTLWVLAAISVVVFILCQIVPNSDSESQQLEQSTRVITTDQAAEHARQFAKKTLGFSGALEDPLITYESRSDLYGYLTREDLMGDYLKKFDKQFPTDVFQVRFDQPGNGLGALTVDVHMTSGAVVGFEEKQTTGNSLIDLLEDTKNGTGALEPEESMMSWEEKMDAAQPYLKALGFQDGVQFMVDESPEGLYLTITDYEIGKSQAEVLVSFDGDRVSGIESTFTVPQEYTDYVDKQTTIASWLTYLGYGLLTFVLGILAIVYSALTKVHTSFKRGIFLASVYFVISMFFAFNMLPYFEKEGIDLPVLIFTFIVQGIITLIMAASVYFSLVGGDGLWRKQGIALWARAKEPGYGRHVLASMADGYAWALILLGVQSVIYLVLDNTIQSWSTTDASQSPYNMLYPLLFPLAAWMAGIGEEAVYRLFGIPMLKKMFRSTFVACVITTLIWALGHTLYPIYPFYTRPVELLFIGLLFSYIFLRYGFMAAMFSHIIFDSILMSLSLMFMGGTVNIAAGVFYIVLPAIVAYVIYLFNPPGRERPPLQRTQKEEPLFTTPHPEGHL